MLVQRFKAQPDTPVLDLIGETAARAEFEEVRGAYAYASRVGATLLADALSTNLRGWDRCRKRWLLSLDWCRTEPQALELLDGLSRSTVRLVDGAVVAGRKGCTPRKPWHPKTLLLSAPNAFGLVLGSGNMSRNGLTAGHETVTSVFVGGRRTAAERQAFDECAQLEAWFDRKWRQAAPLAGVSAEYETRYAAAAKGPPPIIDDDVLPTKQRRWMNAERARKLRTSDHLWIQAGNLHENRGRGNPGNQLMMTPMTRIFFGFPATDKPTNTLLGTVVIRYRGTTYPESLRFSDNAMDVLNLPIPGPPGPGPVSYDGETLRFEKIVLPDGTAAFELELGTGAQRTRWRQRSAAKASNFAMQSGREWGVY